MSREPTFRQGAVAHVTSGVLQGAVIVVDEDGPWIFESEAELRDSGLSLEHLPVYEVRLERKR